MSAPQPPRPQPQPKQTRDREVLDPVAHLPVLIHDNDEGDLNQVPVNESTPLLQPSQVLHHYMSGVIQDELNSSRWHIEGYRRRTQLAILVGAAAGVGTLASLVLLWLTGPSGRQAWLDFLRAFIACACGGLVTTVTVLFLQKHPDELEKHDSPAPQKKASSDQLKPFERPESATWVNAFLGVLWPLINPALFVSVADMIEDTLQSSLPKMINGVRVADLHQGSEPLRLLGIRSINSAQTQGSSSNDENDTPGDFVNLELAIAYRARPTEGKAMDLKQRSRNAHLFMEFWVAGALAPIKLPVWVELSGFVGTLRLRLGLTPDPPFLSSMTLTLLGQPKVSMKCTPLSKNFLDVMDIPGLSGWLHRSIDAAISSYVAPRSLTLDLRTMLSGREKMDTDAVGIVVVTVKRAWGFRHGDESKVWQTGDGARTSDPYVTVGWGKLGKPLWSTRIIEDEKQPIWEETAVLLVTPADINAEEKLRLQLWDSDRFTADDSLGAVDVPLGEIMSSETTVNTFCDREDSLHGEDGSECPGSMTWSLGFFEKTTTNQHLQVKPDLTRTPSGSSSSRKSDDLLDAKPETLDPIQREKLKLESDELISQSSPLEEWPSGILSIHIGQITGLEVPNVRKSGVQTGGDIEDSDDLPSTYCTIILNHRRVYKTRTKMKNSSPYFNAGTEQFIPDWRKAEVMIAVRDARVHEGDALIGVIVLPLRRLFKEHSQVTDSLPLVGGVGFGRLQFSLLFRSVQAKLPPGLLAWDVGTLEVHPKIEHPPQLPAELQTCKLIVRTLHSKAKFPPHADGHWNQKRDRPARLAVTKRNASCLVIMIKKKANFPDIRTRTHAFAVLWLKDIAEDEHYHDVILPIIRKTDSLPLKKALSNVVDTAADGHDSPGELTLKLKFWPGLSGYHQKLSDKDEGMADVMEALDCAEASVDHNEGVDFESEGSSSSSSEDSSGDSRNGLIDELRDYRKRQGDLHRKHRGLMQWKAGRQLAWVGTGLERKADGLKTKVKDTLKHQQMDNTLETEV